MRSTETSGLEKPSLLKQQKLECNFRFLGDLRYMLGHEKVQGQFGCRNYTAVYVSLLQIYKSIIVS